MKFILSLLVSITLACAAVQAKDIPVKSGEKIAFLGDSITQFGTSKPSGYVCLVMKGFTENGIAATPIPAGTSGNTSKDMLARLDKVIEKKPDWMTLSCGVNDVWHGDKGVGLEEYKTNVKEIVKQAKAANIRVVILTATPIKEDPQTDFNKKLAAYNDFLRSLAKEENLPLADLNERIQTVLKASAKPGFVLTQDGVHMNPHGDELMATEILKTFGFVDAQLKKAQDAWSKIPGAWDVRTNYQGSSKPKSLPLTLPLTRAQYEKLETVIKTQPKPSSVENMVLALYTKDVRDLLKPTGTYESVDAIFDAKADAAVKEQLKQTLIRQIEEMLKSTAK